MQDTKNLSWLDYTTSLFRCPADNFGKARTFRQILFSDFAIEHKWFFKDPVKRWISGSSIDLEKITLIRNGVTDKSLLKQTLQCFTPSAYYKSKKKGKEVLISYTNLIQFDFDQLDGFDLEETKEKIFTLPFVAFVAKSVSGKALFCLILIGEPDKLKQYAEHCFGVFNHYGLIPDTTKGRNYSDLRYVSYDCNMLYREYPQPLTVIQFNQSKQPATKKDTTSFIKGDDRIINWAVNQLQAAQAPQAAQGGTRFETVRKVSYTLGGCDMGLDAIKSTILNSSQYAGEETEFINLAENCFEEGKLKPML